MCLMTGLAVRSAAVGKAVLMAFVFFVVDVWPENNPITSSHVIEMVAFLGIACVGAGKFSLQKWANEKIPALSKIP